MDCFRIIIAELTIIHRQVLNINNLEITYEFGIVPIFCHGPHILVFEKKKLRDIIWIFNDLLILYRVSQSLQTSSATTKKSLLDNFIILRIEDHLEYGINFIEKSFLIELFEITEKTYTFIRLNIKATNKTHETTI